ncbi:MAG: hypothetical protein JO056_03310 [Alphaproteobacteria bacterium]|nr:hypothetical protein [Alphaproteobacteria bacterium]
MITKTIIGLAAATATAGFGMSAHASPAAFDPHRCSAIQNVDVPYEVSIAGDRIAFAGSGKQIVLAPTYMEVNGHRFADATLSPAYYQNVRAFLHSAGAFPKTAAEFGKTAFLPGQARRDFLSGVTAMCRSILTLADGDKRMHGAFADFVSPVEITLKAQHL